MNPMLQRHCAKYIYIVPHGLRELMMDISREVIRALPEDMYTFIADYLDALMITRENARVAIKLVDSISEIAETVVELLTRTGMTREEADAIVRVIQRYFREFLDRKHRAEHPEEYGEGFDEVEAFTHKILREIHVDYDKLVAVTIIIQNAYRKFKARREREKLALFGMIDWRIAARSTIRLYRKTGVTRYEADRAATLIKAAYKGYYTRRIMKRLLNMAMDDQTTVEETLESDTTIPDLALDDVLSVSSAELDRFGESLPTQAIYETQYDEQQMRGGEQTDVSEFQIDAEPTEGVEFYGEVPGEGYGLDVPPASSQGQVPQLDVPPLSEGPPPPVEGVPPRSQENVQAPSDAPVPSQSKEIAPPPSDGDAPPAEVPPPSDEGAPQGEVPPPPEEVAPPPPAAEVPSEGMDVLKPAEPEATDDEASTMPDTTVADTIPTEDTEEA